MLRKEHTQDPWYLGFPSSPFPLLCTHLFYPHSSLPASVCDTHTQTQTLKPRTPFTEIHPFPPL